MTPLSNNKCLNSFYGDVADRFNRDSLTMTNGEWICTNTSLNKKPFNFSRYPFQEQIANDMHENLSCIKPSQVGLTEIQIRKSLTIMKRFENRNLIYTMPNDKMFKRISKTRILPIVEYDKAFRDVVNGKNRLSMDLIPIGSNFMYVTGSTEGDATSIDADFLFHDEVDLTCPKMLALFSSRLQGSDLRIRQSFSTPKWEGMGIHKMFSSSDQHEYMIKCRCCNHWQIPLFNKDFIYIKGGCLDMVNNLDELEERMVDDGKIQLETIVLKCSKCHRPLNLKDYDNRQWVAKHPQRTHSRGYYVRPFSTHTLSPKYILTELFKYKSRDNLAGWQNTVLGETASAGNKRLSQPQIENVMLGETIQLPSASTPCYMGIDVGQTCNIVIGTGPSIAEVEVILFITCHVDSIFSVVTRLSEQYNIVGGGMDKFPYTPTSNAVRDLTGGKIIPVDYKAGKELVEEKDSFGRTTAVVVNRTMMIDHVANGIRNAGWRLKGYGSEKSVVITHLMDMVREESDEGQAVWVKLNNTDHYFHALAYMVSGMIYHGISQAKLGHQSVADNPFEGLLSEEFQNFNSCQDLIGYSVKSQDSKNIITRY